MNFFKNINRLPITFCLLFNIAYAQEQKVLSDSLYSQILNEKRQLHIVLPKNYNPTSNETYEVIYCLDDISDFLIMEWDMLQWEGFIPKNMIIVGITNPKINGVDMRERDFTPSKTSDISGGADKFLLFMKTELLPFINGKYNGADKGNTIYGGSLGGLFVIYNLLYEPALFTSYIAIDPSLWWDNHLLNNIAATKLDSIHFAKNTLFIVGRAGNSFREMGIEGFDSLLRTKKTHDLDWKCVTFSNETHYSTNFKGFWDGLKFSYGGFYASSGGYNTSKRIVLKPKAGIVLKDEPFKLICYNLMADTYLHYTTDGTEPNSLSPTLAGEETSISLSKSSKIIVKSIGARPEYDRMDSAHFVIGEVFKSIPNLTKIKLGGLHYTYYEGIWDSTPDVTHLKPIKRGIADESFNINKLTNEKDFICILNGYLKINSKGYYILEMGNGNQHSKVYLNNRLVLGQNFIEDEGEFFLAPLEAGYYYFRIEYLHKKGDSGLSPIYIKPEGLEDYIIPLDMLYHTSD